MAFFKKKVQKLGFSIFSVLSLNFENSLFGGLLKHYKNRGLSNCLGFFVVAREDRRKKMTIGISEFWFFCPKMAVS